MRTHTLFKVAVLSGLLALSGCASKITQPDKYSGFLKDYSGLKETTSATGKPVLRCVETSKEGLQFYEVVPVALVVAGTQMATGHRTMDTHLYFEGELIDAATNKPVVKVVRQGEGKDLSNENTPMAFETLKEVIDDMATDATMFDVGKK